MANAVEMANPSLAVVHGMLTEVLVQRAYAQVEHLFSRLSCAQDTSSESHGFWSDLLLHWKPQTCKAQLQMSLQEWDELKRKYSMDVDGSNSSTSFDDVMGDIVAVEAALRAEATSYLTDVTGSMPTASRVLKEDLSKSSMFRMWMYRSGGECRPHYDPGLVTALLRGSRPGLAFNVTESIVPSERLGDYSTVRSGGGATDAALRSMESQSWTLSHDAAKPCDGFEPILIMANTTLQVISGGALPHVLHGVRTQMPLSSPDVPLSEAVSRVNLVVELRPARSWYQYQPTPEDEAAVRAFMAARRTATV